MGRSMLVRLEWLAGIDPVDPRVVVILSVLCQGKDAKGSWDLASWDGWSVAPA